MNQFSKYPYLPGMMVEFKDGGMQLSTQPNEPTTGSLLILGTAIDGPINEPVKVDPEYVSSLFGSATESNGVSNGSTLVTSYEAAFKVGCRDIRLMRISGSESSISIKGEAIVSSTEKITEELGGVILGSEESTFSLSLPDVVINESLLKVYANGKLIDNALVTFADSPNTVVVAANASNAGATVSIEFPYKEEIVTSNSIVSDDDVANGNFVLPYEIKDITTFVLKVTDAAGAVVDAGDYTIEADNKTITISNGNGGLYVIGDTFFYDYTGFTGDNLTQVDDNSLALATGTQTFTVIETPIADQVLLYQDGTQILSDDAFVVDATNKQIIISKEFFEQNSQLTIRYSFVFTESYDPEILITSNFGGSIYNQGSVSVTDIVENTIVVGKVVTISKPASKKAQIAEEALTYSTLMYPTFELLAEAITNDAYNGVYQAETNNGSILSSKLLLKTEAYLTGGIDGVDLTKQELFEKLSGVRDAEGRLLEYGAYQLLEDYNVDYVAPTGVYLDDVLIGKNSNFAYELGMFLGFLSYRTSVTIGAISAKPNTDVTLLGKKNYVNNLVGLSNTYVMLDPAGNAIKNADGEEIDLGKFLSTVVGPTPVIDLPSLSNAKIDPNVIYMALETTLKPQASTTNKRVNTKATSLKLRYEFSNAQLNDLTKTRFVTFKTKDDGGIIVIDGVTSAKPTSDYTRINTADIVKETVNQVRKACEPYLGEPNNIAQRNAMSSAISKVLENLKISGALTSSSFNVTSTLIQQLLGEASISLELVTPQELRKISTTVKLSPM